MVPTAKGNQNTSFGPSNRNGTSPRTVDIIVSIMAVILWLNARTYFLMTGRRLLSFMYALARYIPALTTTDMLVTRSIRYFRIYWNDKNRLTAPRTLDKVLRTINRKICGLLPAWSRSKSVTGKSISFCEQVQLVLLYLHY